MIGKIFIPFGTETEVIAIEGMELAILTEVSLCYVNGIQTHTTCDFILDDSWVIQETVRRGSDIKFQNEKYIEKRAKKGGAIAIGMYLNGDYLVKI